MHPSTTHFLPERSRAPSRAGDLLLGVIAGLVLAFGTSSIATRQRVADAPPSLATVSAEPKVQWSTVNLIGYQVKNGAFEPIYTNMEVGYRPDGVVVWRPIRE
jgi:hypothetical protein